MTSRLKRKFIARYPLSLIHHLLCLRGYCQQMDTHLPETTVREALLFSAKLRQPQDVPVAEKEA